MSVLELSFESGEESLSVRRFVIHEAMSSPFDVSVFARSPQDDIDLESITGKAASFRLMSGLKHAPHTRRWTGICREMELLHVEPTGLSTYAVRIVPRLWLLTQRVTHRAFQHISVPEIVERILREHRVEADLRLDRAAHRPLELRVQYGESDFAFVSRLLEEAGISYFFRDDEKLGSVLVLADAPQSGEARAGAPLPYVDNPNQAAEREFVTEVRLRHEVRPGKVSLRDFDFRRSPEYRLVGESSKAPAPEDALEHYRYLAGSSLVEGNKPGDTPVGDDRGVARHADRAGQEHAERRLESLRSEKRLISLGTNAVDLAPGVIFSMAHPRPDLAASKKLLSIELTLEGAPGEEWTTAGHAVFADRPYRPQLRTPKPQIHSLEGAVVVGPKGEEIHTDEYGRVRVQFHWDREGTFDELSSCWMRVSQGWAGQSYGTMMIPRIGHEVLVGFLGGDPDHPVVMGRLYNNASRVPYKLPKRKTRSTWKSDSSPGANGFNEIMFEDLKGEELVYVQAERDLKKLVKVDEAITVGNDRRKLVKQDEFERVNRDRHVNVDRSLFQLVKGDETARTRSTRRTTVEEDDHLVVKHDRFELVEQDRHEHVKRDHTEKVGGVLSLVVGDRYEALVGDSHAIEAGQEIHVRAGARIVLEAGARLTFKGPGGFIDIDDEGVVIQGAVVRINSGGSAGEGRGARTTEPKDAEEAQPGDPEAEDIFKRDHE